MGEAVVVPEQVFIRQRIEAAVFLFRHRGKHRLVAEKIVDHHFVEPDVQVGFAVVCDGPVFLGFGDVPVPAFDGLVRVDDVRGQEEGFSVFHGKNLPEDRGRASVFIIRIGSEGYILVPLFLAPSAQAAGIDRSRDAERVSVFCSCDTGDPGGKEQGYSKNGGCCETEYATMHHLKGTSLF